MVLYRVLRSEHMSEKYTHITILEVEVTSNCFNLSQNGSSIGIIADLLCGNNLNGPLAPHEFT